MPNVSDKRIFFKEDLRDQVTEILRQFRPDLIITHSPRDYIFDHEHTSMLARDAAMAVPSALFETGAFNPQPATEHVPYLYYCEPTHQIDIYGNGPTQARRPGWSMPRVFASTSRPPSPATISWLSYLARKRSAWIELRISSQWNHQANKRIDQRDP